MNIQDTKKKFRYTEKLLYDYRRNVARLDVLREDLRVKRITGDIHGQRYDRPVDGVHAVSDPVFAYIEQLERIEEQIKMLERKTAPITRLLTEMRDTGERSKSYEQLKIFELYYVSEYTVQDVIDELNLSRTAFFRRKNALVYKAQDYLGL